MNIMNIQLQHLHLTPATIFILDETGNGLCGINILKGILDVDSFGSNNSDKINNGIVNGMFIFICLNFFFIFGSLCICELGSREPITS